MPIQSRLQAITDDQAADNYGTAAIPLRNLYLDYTDFILNCYGPILRPSCKFEARLRKIDFISTAMTQQSEAHAKPAGKDNLW